ncbi:hypothetical protein ACNA6I_01275 [Rossellomorea sp. FS2]|uniref:hypothetical protein n=1 Tax=Rossellomorea sp. FS2 TaxID=3391447 RepID=UPI003A4DE81A
MAKMTINGQTFEGSVDELVELKAKIGAPLKVGDYAKIIHRPLAAHGFSEGDVVELFENHVGSSDFMIVAIGKDLHGFSDKVNLIRATDEEVAKAKKRAQPETITHEGVEYRRVDREAREGDVVVFTETTSAFVANKTPYVVGSGLRVTSGWPVYNDRADRTPANVKVYEPIVDKPAPLQVGDYAKVVGSSIYFLWDYEVGDIAEVTRFRDDGYIFVKSEGKKEEFMHASQLIRATDEEVAEAKRQQAEKAVADKWAEIGRKPNEFKEGDIVRYTGSATTKGSYVEVVKDTGVNGRTTISWGKSRSSEFPRDIELITPVEHRFDKPAGDSE